MLTFLFILAVLVLFLCEEIRKDLRRSHGVQLDLERDPWAEHMARLMYGEDKEGQ